MSTICNMETTNPVSIEVQFCEEHEKNKASSLNGEHPQLQDSQVHTSTKNRGNEVKSLDTGQDHPKGMEENQACSSLAQENQEKGEDDDKSILVDIPLVSTRDDSIVSGTKMDPVIWIPPEPEYANHDMDSVANYEDDDADEWGQPSSLCSLDGENFNRHDCKEERHKAMMGAMNGQFKIIVTRLLALEGLDSSHRECGENWLEIVTSLSWEAAMLIKPDSDEGPSMDPVSYLKVKCIASGARSESQVIKGLVFKKNTAHKHMPTKLRHPRLLLFRGALAHSATGLSSLQHMEQEDDYKKLIIEMIENCRPDMVLVEKTVSRDLQEYLLEKGITLVADMKLSRLEKVALCIGSEIISSANVAVRPKLKQCDSFHIEKFVEEHNSSGEGGKKQSKTLMFFEGCPKPLGCTILLKGCHSDELKKVKHVLHSTVSAAHHLILETLFFVDQRTIFADTNIGSPSTKAAPTSQLPVSDGSLEIRIHDGMLDLDVGKCSVSPASDPAATSAVVNDGVLDSTVSVSHGHLLSSVSASLRKFVGDNLPSLRSRQFISYFGSGAFVSPEKPDEGLKNGENVDEMQIEHENGHSNQHFGSSAVGSPEKPDEGIQNGENADEMQIENENDRRDQQEPDDESSYRQNDVVVVDHSVSTANFSNEDTGSVLNPQSILVFLSSHCIPKRMVCEQRHLSRINYYGNFDVSLGRYLQETFFNPKHGCSACGEPPEAHEYRYTHQNGNITVLVRRLPKDLALSGENEGRIWMWTRCSKCEHEKGIPRTTRRVVMSSDARGLSFGKFLKLSFSCYYAASRLSECGHQLHRDCLRFFGMGSKVAMFRYTTVEIYDACKTQVPKFLIPSKQEWFTREVRDILSKADIFFNEVGNLLKMSRHSTTNAACSLEKLDEVKEMLIRDRTEFEASLLKAIDHQVQPQEEEYWILDLNWLIQELLVMLYVWDRRLHSIISCSSDNNLDRSTQENCLLLEDPDRISIEVMDITGTQHESTSEELIVENSSESMAKESSLANMLGNTCDVKCIPILDDKQSDSTIPVEETYDLDQESQKCQDSKPDECKRWIWAPFSRLRKELKSDLHGGYLHKFEFINTYSPFHLSPMQELVSHVANTLHFPVDSGGNILSVVEDEISSIIACSLALSEDRYTEIEGKGGDIDMPIDDTHSMLASSHWSVTGYLESELASLGSDLSLFMDRPIPTSNLHPEISVGSDRVTGKSKYYVVCIYGKQFYSLRRRCRIPETAYISSLSRCKKWDAQGGKSKVLFAKTMDDRFIIKQVKKPELQSFLKFGPDYFKHVSDCLDSGSQICLTKIFGLYQVRQYKNGKEVKTDVVVMENLFFGRNIFCKYDLKGAVFSRYVPKSNDSESVLLDENFVEDMRVSPIYVGERTKHLLERAIWNDTAFLTANNVMDYSLLVGIDRQKHEIVFGIIDYLRQYTWDKHLETWVKAHLVVPKNELPTVVSPREYKKRFRKFMTKYFLTVPDSWISESCSGSCKSCTHGVSKSVIELGSSKTSLPI